MDTNTLDSRLQQLYARPRHVIRLGLETITAILDRLDNPHRHLACIHVAGTNGKGSVCAMIESVLRAAGYSTGLYTSPHLVRFNERIRVNGIGVDDATLAESFERVEQAETKVTVLPGGRPATFFEFTTAMAFDCFNNKAVDVVVLETGMGGRLDATNVVDPMMSIMTPISLEHTAYLGESIEKIAEEKAGIIKSGRPVICAGQSDEARSVIRAKATAVAAPFFQVGDRISIRRLRQDAKGQRLKIETETFSLKPLLLPLLGEFQIENCAMTVTALDVLSSVSPFACDSAAMKRGLENVRWLARGQILAENPLTILDVAHNPAGAGALVAMLDGLFADRAVGLVAGMLADKDARGFFRAFGRRVKWCRLVELPGERNMPPPELLSAACAAGLPAEWADLDSALSEAKAWANRTNGLICIAGSLVLAGMVLGTEKVAGEIGEIG